MSRVAALGAVGLVAVVVMGQAAPTRTAKVVEAERFVLKDTSGRLRASIAVQANGATVLGITDQKGLPRLLVEVLADGTPGVDMYDQNGKSRVVIGVQEDGRPLLVFYDQNGKSRVDSEARADGSPVLALGDQHGRPRAGLEVGPDGRARMALFGPAAGLSTRAAIGVEADGTPAIVLLDRTGKVSWKAPQP
jgi:hypothetical protein